MTTNPDNQINLKGKYWSTNMTEDGKYDIKLFGYRYEDLNIDLDKTAFLVVDVYGSGYDMEDPIPNPEDTPFGTSESFIIEKEMINKKIKPAIDAARSTKLKIIYIENRYKPYLTDEKSEFGKFIKRFWGLSVKDCLSKQLRYSKVIAPRAEDFVVQKRFYGAFTNTELDYLLRNLGIKNLICVGFTADICLFFTLYEAWTQNYKIILLRDCTLAFEPSIDSIKDLTKTKHSIEFIERYIGHTITSGEFIESCKNKG